LAAIEKKDYTKAAELLLKAAETDPKLEDVWEDLGRARYELHDDEDAVAAFTRQIEVAPFHESAYAWRAHSLVRMNRWPEAEKDLLKQIEVAPFKSWSYEKLAERRMQEGRARESADYYARAAAIEPKEPERWLKLASAQMVALQSDDARASLEKGLALDTEDWMKVDAARILRGLGDSARAGELAQAALPSLARRLAKLSPDGSAWGDTYWTERLIEAWRFVGEAALKTGDLARAERYLDAAWRAGFSAEAGWALGELREKQGRLADAADLWTMATTVPAASIVLPPDFKDRIEAACRKLPAPRPSVPLPPGMPKATVAAMSPSRLATAGGRLTELRTVRLTGTASADASGDVQLLVAADGRVERVSRVSRKPSAALDRQLASFGQLKVPAIRPDVEPFKLVRRALVVCATVSGCALVFDLPNRETPPVLTAAVGTLKVLSVEPKDGGELVAGQRLTVVAKMQYDQLTVPEAFIALAVVDRTGKVLSDHAPERVGHRSGEIVLSTTVTVPAAATGLGVIVSLYPVGGLPLHGEQAAQYKVRRQ
jgi:tetratricopeptide (TPR) repeat protein